MAMLALLDTGPSHGFDLKRRYDELLGHERALKYGQVYATLQRLERDGLAAGVGLQPGAGADRRVYAITADGIAELDSWLASAEAPPLGRDGIFARVVLALASGRPAERILDAHRRVFLDRMRELTALRPVADAVAKLAADYEIAHLEADLRWIELAASRLEAPHEVLSLRYAPGESSRGETLSRQDSAHSPKLRSAGGPAGQGLDVTP
jgi:DNA-binding PadR family transcriptional regulator